MGRYFRVHPYLPTAGLGEKGNPFYVVPGARNYRIDNPDEYSALYVSESAAGAFAESFANRAIWTPEILACPADMPGSQKVLTEYEGDIDLVNLDDGHELSALDIKPSRVVSRNRQMTQAWALGIYRSRGGAGVRWWSYHDPDWISVGLWDPSGLRVVRSTPIDLNNNSLIEASGALNRQVKTT